MKFIIGCIFLANSFSSFASVIPFPTWFDGQPFMGTERSARYICAKGEYFGVKGLEGELVSFSTLKLTMNDLATQFPETFFPEFSTISLKEANINQDWDLVLLQTVKGYKENLRVKIISSLECK